PRGPCADAGHRHRRARRPRQVHTGPRPHRDRAGSMGGGAAARADHRSRLRLDRASLGAGGLLRRRARARTLPRQHAHRARTGPGLDTLPAQLGGVVTAVRRPDADARVRLWVDRAFAVAGTGTVVTGTLAAGTLRREDRLVLIGTHGSGNSSADGTEVQVRGLQSRGGELDELGPVSRAAVNLRGVEAEQVGRGDALLSPGAWHLTAQVDVRRTTGAD